MPVLRSAPVQRRVGVGFYFVIFIRQVVEIVSCSGASIRAARLRRAAIIRDTTNPAGIAVFGIIQTMAPSLGMEVIPINLRDAGEFERSMAAFARVPNGGLVVTPSAPSLLHRNLIVALAAQYKLPAVYFERTFAAAGGLVSYGADFLDQYRQAATYVDRILKGEKPADMPV